MFAFRLTNTCKVLQAALGRSWCCVAFLLDASVWLLRSGCFLDLSSDVLKEFNLVDKLIAFVVPKVEVSASSGAEFLIL